jgi:glycosyltransferase involved in cell wall biosynthesis
MLTRKKSTQIFYPYNEHLPCKRAHDVYVFQNCHSLSQEGFDTTLICGHRSSKNLVSFYLGDQISSLKIQREFHLRKSRFFGISWNRPFFQRVSTLVRNQHPSFVISSVLKQGDHLLKKKIPGVRYVYEVHELAYYPGRPLSDKFYFEREMLKKMDLIVVTTKELKRILESPPYALTNRIEVVELGVQRKSLPMPQSCAPFKLLYVGQLYKGQGVENLILAMENLKGIKLQVVGGKPEEVARLKKIADKVEVKVQFFGFVPPSQIEEIAKECHACAAPFELTGRMPYVAHTKLYEYAMWGRPILAPETPLVTQTFKHGIVTYRPGEMALGIQTLQNEYAHLLSEMHSHPYDYTWQRRGKRYHALLSSCL